MKSKFLGLAIALALFGSSPAMATTYNYIGPAFDSNPDPASFGTNMTGSVTFTADTSAYSGYIDSSQVGAVQSILMNAGIFSLSYNLGQLIGIFHFTSGVIDSWCVAGVAGVGGGCAGGPLGGFAGDGLQSLYNKTMVNGIIENHVEEVSGVVVGVCDGPMECSPNDRLTSWTEADGANTTPLPAALPLFAGGAGLIGLLARRRKRKAALAA